MRAMIFNDEWILQKESIRRFMYAHGLTIAAWTRKAGLADSTLRTYLNSKTQRSLNLINLERLAKSVGVEVEYILNFGRSKSNLSNSMPFDLELMNKIGVKLFKEMRENEENTGKKISAYEFITSLGGMYRMALMEEANKKIKKFKPKEKENNHS